MAILHTVNKSPLERDALEACLARALPDSTVLLIEDGVYAAVAGAESEARVRGALDRHRVCALAPDLAARGIDARRVVEGVELVDYEGFVDLATEHHGVVAWL